MSIEIDDYVELNCECVFYKVTSVEDKYIKCYDYYKNIGTHRKSDVTRLIKKDNITNKEEITNK
jgi:hypothetical protein